MQTVSRSYPLTCAACDAPIYKPEGNTVATGYALTEKDEVICYKCAAWYELENAAESGKLFAYVNSKGHEVTTWSGEFLGHLYDTKAAYVSNMGDTRVPISVYVPNPKTDKVEIYHGTYYKSAGDYCRLKRSKQVA